MASTPVLETPAISIPDPLNIATYFIDRNLELGRADNIAIYEEARQLSYAQLAEMVNRTGNALRALGIQAENRVLLAMSDSAEFIATFFGAAKIGAIPVPINPGSPASHFLYYLNDTGAKALVVQEDLWPQLETTVTQARSLRHVVLACAPSETSGIAAQATAPLEARYRCHSYCQLLAGASPTLEAEPTSKDDIAFFLYTSGS
ncbi:MAG: AMP-binding protein, partial [Acidobacteria bacterium]|nr:AMP-binding protein [Acidobacteriota bacterium]